MSESLAPTLTALPEDLLPAATNLWSNAAAVTETVSEPLAAAFAVLVDVRGDPAALDVARRSLIDDVAGSLSTAADRIDDALAQRRIGWHGAGADTVDDRLSGWRLAAIALAEAADRIAESIAEFAAALSALWTAVIERTWHAAAEVVVERARYHGLPGGDATVEVSAVVDRYAGYVGDLADALAGLSGPDHRAGRILASAGRTPPELTAVTETDRLGTDDAVAGSLDVDLTALARMTTALHDTGGDWRAARDGLLRAGTELLTPEVIGLAGRTYYFDLCAVLDRHSRWYADADRRLTGLGDTLRQVSSGYRSTDADAAEAFDGHLEDD